MDEDDNDVPVGEIGEIVVRGKNVMQRLLERPRAHRESPAGRVAAHRRPRRP